MNRKKRKMLWSQPARDKILAEREEAKANSEARKQQYLKSEKYQEKKAWGYFKAELKSKSGCLGEDIYANTYKIAPDTRDYTKDMSYPHGEIIPPKKSEIFYTVEGHRYHC